MYNVFFTEFRRELHAKLPCLYIICATRHNANDVCASTNPYLIPS